MIQDRDLPSKLEALNDLAADLRFSGSSFTHELWKSLDAETWERTGSAYAVLLTASRKRLKAAAKDKEFLRELEVVAARRKKYRKSKGWFGREHADSGLSVAYFSMEFGLSEALPIYSGGLGILAGDHLKSASDLGVPLVGIGLLYQQGYFRQVLGDDGKQLEAFPYNAPSTLPVRPVEDSEGAWQRVRITLPGRDLWVRVWEARVGKVKLYLLDSNDPSNGPWDRGITAQLYDAGKEKRLLQEIVLGWGGWRLTEELGLKIKVCHLNEGHAAFAVLARARSYARDHGVPMNVALAATRAGNVFTTHTPVEAAFDKFDPGLLHVYAQRVVEESGVPYEDFLALGRVDPSNADEPFNMAYLAMRGSSRVNGVARLHGQVSKRLFGPLYPDWPEAEVPVGHVTNGVHVPTWHSAPARALWKGRSEKSYAWAEDLAATSRAIGEVDDATLWNLRKESRQLLVDYVRRRYARQLRENGAPETECVDAEQVLDPRYLTLGFARRFTEYKRPNLVLHDADRFARILMNADRPVQFVVAGKAHPSDEHGKGMVEAFACFSRRDDVGDRVVFLQDYDMALAHHLATGIDVWLNNPRRPNEACGTSGMKMLVNGGLNFSTLDGWWDEAFEDGLGWGLGGGREHGGDGDADEAIELYETLENQIAPEFYDRGENGIPTKWVARIRASMSRLTQPFSSDRMVQEYTEQAYLPAARAYAERTANDSRQAQEITTARTAVRSAWDNVRFTGLDVTSSDDGWDFEVVVDLGGLRPENVRVELFADAQDGGRPEPAAMRLESPVSGSDREFTYTGTVPSNRPAEHYTPRIVAAYGGIAVPLEDAHIRWYRR